MGSSRMIMISGVYLIFGFYIASLNRMDNVLYSSSVKTASLVQSEQASRTGLAKALNYMGTNSALFSFATRTVVVNGDTVRYSASRPAGFPASQTLVTSTASFTGVADGSVLNRRTTTMKAVYQYHNGRWKVMRIFTENSYQDAV